MKVPRKKKNESEEKILYPEVNIGTIGHIAHGKSTLVHAITGKWTQEHSEELKRGLTIRLGYADFTMRKCKKCNKYTTKEKCEYCGGQTKPIRRISFVDSPGHETLMATMLSGAATMDGAILVIAANEPCPQPQTKEHLLALEISGVKNIIVVQNKIDLVSKEQAIENYKQIKEFLKGTIAEKAPIIPVSAQYGANLDILLEAIEKYIPTPKRDLKAHPIFLVVRSFDVNKPGTKLTELKGGVLGGILKQGKLKIKEKIKILPGIKVNDEWKPLYSKIVSVSIGGISAKELVPGGSAGIGTELDPVLTKSDALVGQVVGLEGKMPPVWNKLKLEVHLLKRVVGSKEELEIQPLRTNEPLMINAWTARTVGIITSAHDNKIDVVLKLPVCISKGERVVLSRRIGQKWRLVGYGIII
ncbi:MAG: translation initiation factor IF-2 subunit gamma [Nanoarchaeota archaeon]|nr:translation initiation factor IF-2 subunit gamma [Nanoarchaeota archaeon]